MNNFEIEEDYTRIEKRLQKSNTLTCLETIWAYTMKCFFKDIDIGNNVQINSEFTKLGYFSGGGFGFMLIRILKDILTHSGKYKQNKFDISKQHDFGKLYNQYMKLDGTLSQNLTNDTVFLSLMTLGHDQFTRQHINREEVLGLYCDIYSTEPFKSKILELYNINYIDIAKIYLTLFAFFMKKPVYDYNIISNEIIKLCDAQSWLFFKNHFMANISDIQIKLKDSINIIDEHILSNGKEILMSKSLYKKDDILICPMLPLLFKSITEGMRYNLIKGGKHQLSLEFGNAFEAVIGEISKKIIRSSDIFFDDGKGDLRKSKPSIDWILTKNNETIFIEVKTYIPNYKFKTTSVKDDNFWKEVESKYLKAIIQLYKSLNSYLNGDYKEIECSSDTIYLLAVFPDDWFISFLEHNESYKNEFDKSVKKLFNKNKLPIELLTKYKVAICSEKYYKVLLTLINKKNISTIINPFLGDKKYIGYTLGSYLHELIDDNTNIPYPYKHNINTILKSIFDKLNTK